MGILCCSSQQKTKQNSKYCKLSTIKEIQIEKSKQELKKESKCRIFHQHYLKILQKKYQSFNQTEELNLIQFGQLLPNISKDLQARKQILNLQDISKILSAIFLTNKFEELLFDIYDFDRDGKLNSKELKLLFQENTSLFHDSDFHSLNQKYCDKNQFSEWAQNNKKINKIKQNLFSLDVQKTVMQEIEQRNNQKRMQNKWGSVYLISKSWLIKWEKQFENECGFGTAGPIDNSCISGDQEGELKGGIQQNKDFFIYSKEGWNYLQLLYDIKDSKRHKFKRHFEMNHENKLVIDLYPNIMLGIKLNEQDFETNKEIDVLNKGNVLLLMNSKSTMCDIWKQLFKKFKIETNYGQQYILYFKISDDSWTLVEDLDDNIKYLPSRTFFTIKKINNQVEIFYTGIQNLGNTCYMNSVLQCLIETPILSNFLNQFQPANDNDCSLINQLSDLTKQLKKRQKKNIPLGRFIEAVTGNMPQINLDQDQDAIEFLEQLLQIISEELKNNISQEPLIQQLFQGTYKVKSNCHRCNQNQDKSEDKMIFYLNIQDDSQPIKLENCFQQFKNQVSICNKCKSNIKEIHYMDKAPTILVINLQKRDRNNRYCQSQVDFKLISQSIRDCLNESNDIFYDLYGVINYFEEITKNKKLLGHFTAYVKVEEQWVEFDDSKTQKLDEMQVISKNAYSLFYVKQHRTN